MKKNIITNKITPCCVLPFSEMWFWVSNLMLNTEGDRAFIKSKMSQDGTLTVDAWRVLINSGTLETDAALTKEGFLAWFDCAKKPDCEQLKLIIEGFKISNFNPVDEYGVGWTEVTSFESYNNKIIKKIDGYVGGIGDVPDELQANINKYYAIDGTFTSNKDLAIDFKDYANKANIPYYSELAVPANDKATAVDTYGIWKLKNGQTANIGDVPSNSVLSKWDQIAINWNSIYKDYTSPLLEVNGLALSNGGSSPSTQRGRTIDYISTTYAQQIELVGDMLIQSIFYYTDANVFVSRQDIAAKVFVPTIPSTATKFKLSFHHVVNTQTVTQAELDALILKCYSSVTTSMKNIVDSSKKAEKLVNDYSLVNINIGFGVEKELGRISLTNGADASSTTGIRTKGYIAVQAGNYLITQTSGYKVSRVVNYKDGVFVANNTTFSNGNFIIPNDGTVNQVRIVFDKLPDGTATITAQEVTDFVFSVLPVDGNKIALIYEEAKRTKPLPKVAYFENELLAIVNTTDTEINFDLLNRKLIISGGSIIDAGNVTAGRISLPASSVDLPSSITAGVVLYNKTNNTIIVQNQTAAPLLNHLILFTYRYSGAYSNFFVTGLKNYSINGLPISQKDMRQSNRFSIDNFAVDYWSSPVYPAYNPAALTSSTLYPLYDALVALFPSNITKTVLGQTESPTPYDVLRIDISFNRKTPANQRRRKPKIFVCGGVHGGEKLAVYTTYLFFKILLENPNNDAIISMLRNNYDWTLIPLVNPYALNVGQVGGVESVRWNHNGVDINRNFDFRWAEYADGGIGSQSYKGTAAFSEKESQFVRDVFNSIKDDVVLYLDCHNFGSAGLSDPRCVWFASTFNTVQNTVYSLCDRIDYEFKKRFAYLPKNTLLAFSDIDGASPMSQSWVSNQQIVAVTLETDQSDFFNPDDPSNFNTNVITRSVEAYVNTFYSLGKHSVEIYNSRF